LTAVGFDWTVLYSSAALTLNLLALADVMRSRGAKHILAIDVGSQDDTDLTDYGDHLSGWWLLWKKWNPFASPVKVPNLPDIQSRLAYVSCVRQLEEVKKSDYCEYIRPPIDKFKTLQFGSFDEIKDVGYHHGKTYFAGLKKAGLLGAFTKTEISTDSSKSSSSFFGFGGRPDLSRTQGQQSFTDLAEMVAKVRGPTNKKYEDSDSEEGNDEEYLSEHDGESTALRYRNRASGSNFAE